MAQNQNIGTLGQYLAVNTSSNTVTVNSAIVIGNATVNTVVNSSTITVSSIYANGSLGSNGQALTTNGSTVYWSTIIGTNTAASYTWTNTHTFNANVTIAGNATSVFTVGNASVNVYSNGQGIISTIGESNPNTFAGGSVSTNASLNSVIVGPYAIATGNTLTITTGSRLIII
jgi:hypothetical protein